MEVKSILQTEEVTLNGDPVESEKSRDVLSLFSHDAQLKTIPLVCLIVERVIIDELTRPNSPTVEPLRRSIRARFGEGKR